MIKTEGPVVDRAAFDLIALDPVIKGHKVIAAFRWDQASNIVSGAEFSGWL
ncbi:MAG: hypothetical protein AB3N15_10765 [Paracoccaceae bacterium]